MPVVSVRETEAQTSFKLPITGILGLCSEDTFPSLLLTEGKMLFFSSQNPEDTKACRQSSCYSNRDVIPFNVLPQAFTLLVAWLKILCEAFCNSLVTVPSFPWDWWQISASWAFLAAWPCSIASPYCCEIEIFLSWFRLRYSLLRVCEQWGQRCKTPLQCETALMQCRSC